MESLIRLIQGLTTAEIQFIQVYFKIRSLEEGKRYKLFKLIVSGQIKNNNDALKKIYVGTKNAQSALSHLKKQLSKDILNIIMIISMDDHISKKCNQELECKKSLMQCEILLERGLHAEGFMLLKRTTKLAEKYEFPDINLASFDILSKYYQKADQQNYYYQFERSLHSYQNLLKAKEDYLFGNRHFNISVARENTVDCNFKRTQYWRELLNIENLCRQCEFRMAKQRALDLLNFLDQERLINSDEKESRLHKILAEIMLHLGEYGESVTYVKKACLKLSPGSQDHNNALIILFFTYLRNECFEEAEEVYFQATQNRELDNILMNKWILFKATLKFAERNYKSVNKILSDWDVKYSENPNWNLSPRFLELLTILEVEDYEWYDYRLDCLRKKLSTISSKVTDRVKIVFHLLQSLIRMGFDYDLLVKKELDTFSKLKGSSPNLYWSPLGYELINIPKWILNKTGQFKFSTFV